MIESMTYPTFILLFSLLLRLPVGLSDEPESVYVNDDFESTFEYHTTILYVLNNDYGFQDGVKSLKIVASPQHGDAKVIDNATIRYTPHPGFTGDDQLTYEVCSVHGKCGKGVVDILVMSYDFVPQAVNDTAKVMSGRRAVVDVLQNDADYYNGPISLQIVQEPKNGVATVLPDYEIQYQPDPSFLRIDSLQYSLCDKDNDCDRAWLFFVNGGSDDFSSFLKFGFSPNGDGINDVLFIKELNGYADMNMMIYDRAGTVVYSDVAYTNSWNGISNIGYHKGRLLPCGTYLFQVQVGGVAKVIRGYVYINY